MNASSYYRADNLMSLIFGNFIENCEDMVDASRVDASKFAYMFLKSETMDKLYSGGFDINTTDKEVTSNFLDELVENGSIESLYRSDSQLSGVEVDNRISGLVGSFYVSFMVLEIHPRLLADLIPYRMLEERELSVLDGSSSDYALKLTASYCLKHCNDDNVNSFAQWLKDGKEPTLDDLKKIGIDYTARKPKQKRMSWVVGNNNKSCRVG